MPDDPETPTDDLPVPPPAPEPGEAEAIELPIEENDFNAQPT